MNIILTGKNSKIPVPGSTNIIVVTFNVSFVDQ